MRSGLLSKWRHRLNFLLSLVDRLDDDDIFDLYEFEAVLDAGLPLDQGQSKKLGDLYRRATEKGGEA